MVTAAGTVHRVVHNLIDEVVQAAFPGRADVHPGTLAHRLETLEDGDVLRVIAALLLRALVSAAVSGQKSSEHVETPRDRAARGRPERRKLMS